MSVFSLFIYAVYPPSWQGRKEVSLGLDLKFFFLFLTLGFLHWTMFVNLSMFKFQTVRNVVLICLCTMPLEHSYAYFLGYLCFLYFVNVLFLFDIIELKVINWWFDVR